MDELIGRTLKGKFRITSRLGEGSMGSVYRGIEIETGRDVAIKIMRPGLMREPGMLTRFRREATAMRRVRHPNAVEVFAYGVDDGLVFLAMELVLGGDLAERIAAERVLAPERAARIVADVCGALAEAHAHGVVHRDVKPENVMLGGPSGETVKLIDFGIAKPTDALAPGGAVAAGGEGDDGSMDDSIPESVPASTRFELTTAGTLIGSPGYMAPEQWASSKIDARTDVYACGALLYKLVTGRLPFEAEDPFELATRQLEEQPPAPHTLNPAVAPALSTIVLRALRTAPEDRYQTAAEMRDALCAHLVEREITGALLQFGSTLPLAVPSPLAGAASGGAQPSFEKTIVLDSPAPAAPAAPGSSRTTLPLPDEWAPTQPMPVLLPEGASLAALGKVLPPPAPPADEPAPAAPSIARNGRTSSVPPAPLVRSRKPAHGILGTSRARVVLPLAAAFLALGFAVGLFLFLPLL